MDEFFKIVTPVLFANILTVALVYSFVSYERMKERGAHISGAGFTRIVMVVLVFGLLISGLIDYGALDATPFRHFVASPTEPPTLPLPTQ